jgi:hypothetical protein
MNREDIIRMAREAGCTPFRSPEYWDDVQVFATPDVLERFANLVAAAERNRTWTQDHWTEYERSIAAAEREAIAKLVEEEDEYGFKELAQRIRARGQQ